MLDEIFKNSLQFKNFLKTVKNGNAAHSFLLISKDAFSAQEMANLFAQVLICPNVCGDCENCQKIIHHLHPDVKYFPQGAKLLVDDSKKIVEESFTKPIFADKKIFIIQNVDLSTDEAQNKLLKSLEEPQNNVYYILTTSNSDKVLPTIKSRCDKIVLSPADEEQIQKYITCDEKNKYLALKIGQGFVAKTLQLSKKSNLQELFEVALGLLKDLSSSKDAVVWTKKIVDQKTDFNLITEMASILIEDALLIKVDKNNQITFDKFASVVLEIAQANSIKCLSQLQAVFDRAVRDLSYNVSLPLVADNLVMKILEVKYLCK